MGFERACSIIQNTKGFTDFSKKPSNYATDVFTPIFRKLEELSGKSYVNIYPEPGADRSAFAEEMKTAIAFRVIADHLRTLSFSIADGILPGNNGRNYVLRRILRRAVRYGRQLGFSGDKPFFAALVPTLVQEMGGVFPELKTRQTVIEQTLSQEEASFNQTLDRGLKRFEEAMGGAAVPAAASGILPEAAEKTASGALYSKHHGLPHFERPWGKYMLTVVTHDRGILSPEARQVTLDAIRHFHGSRFILFAAVVMPDHFHMLVEPQPKEWDKEGNAVFWSLGDLMHSIKSFTAKEINKLTGGSGTVWERDYHDRMIRSDSDLWEKFEYITTNPQRQELTKEGPYPYLWAKGWESANLESLRQDISTARDVRQDAERGRRDAGAPLSGDVAFELYDTYGFPIDLTELLCAERGLKVDMPRFEALMEQQRERARAAQKSSVVRALDISTDAVTEFVGFDHDECEATVLEVHPQDDSLFVITDKTVFYAEMGGQVGDTGTVAAVCNRQAEIPVTGVQQIGKARALVIQQSEIHDPPSTLAPGDKVVLRIDTQRRRPVEAHHTATHLLHWALHEAVSRDSAQQGSSVDEHRLRFDFNSAPVSPGQIAAMEEMVNGAIKQGLAVSWTEVKHADIKNRADIMQFFGEKYGDTVRVVQIGGGPHQLNGPSMELCGGTHVRNTSEIGLFKIKSEGAIASGVRRIEAVCGDAAWAHLNELIEKWDHDLKAARAKLAAANEKLAKLGEAAVEVNDFPHIMGAMLAERADINELNAVFAHARRTLEETQLGAIEAEKRIRKIQSAQAARLADEALSALIAKGEPIVVSFESDASLLQELQNGLKKKNFAGPALLVVDDGEKLHLAVHCGPDALAKGLKAGDLLRELAAIAGGKGGGKPDQARGAAPDRSKVEELKKAASRQFGS